MKLIERLLDAFPFSRREIDLLINTAPYRYKVHNIEKRNGRGKRLIAQPTAELKIVQRWLVTSYLRDLPVHDAAIAYRANRSILDHAKKHADGRYLLKLDFENFFPSIRAEDFRLHLATHLAMELPEQVALGRLLFRDDREKPGLTLSIGAPSSPYISNSIMFGFDQELEDFCSKIDVKYSRYADDLALSTNTPNILNEVKEFVDVLCERMPYPRLKLNEAKTVFASKKHRRQLTGLVLSNDGSASIGRERKREIRAMAHRFSENMLEAEDVAKLRGLISFVMSIDKKYIESIKRMLGNDEFRKLMGG